LLNRNGLPKQGGRVRGCDLSLEMNLVVPDEVESVLLFSFFLNVIPHIIPECKLLGTCDPYDMQTKYLTPTSQWAQQIYTSDAILRERYKKVSNK
jgi:hypothetical protein